MGTRLKTLAVAVAAGAPLHLAGCASMTPTQEISSGYAIFDIKATEGAALSSAAIAEAVRTALQKNLNQVQIVNSIPPSPLPERAARFQLSSPFKGTGLAALAAASGQSLQLPSCEGAIMTANARDTSMSRYGEGTTFFACLMPYQGGWSLNVYTTFTKTSGAFSAAALGATLARTVVGDSSQFIPRTISAMVDSVNATGATAKLLEAYP